MLHHSNSSNTLKTYSLHGDLKLTIHLTNNPYNFSPDALFQMAVRINKKRQFLFVSNLLGKHLAVDPAISLGTGSILASLLMESEGSNSIPQLHALVEMVNSGIPNRQVSAESLAYKTKLPTKTVFIGFAETATGLGHAVFHHFQDAHYIHTTREIIMDKEPSFYFEEEHSHATSHRVYASKEILQQAETIVLVDDEITSGRTISNLILALNESYPGKRYKILSILDWRSDVHKTDFIRLMRTNHISAEVIAMLSGQFSLSNQALVEEKELEYLNGTQRFDVHVVENGSNETISTYRSMHGATYCTFTGRFGLTSDFHDKMDEWIQTLINELPFIEQDRSTLVIGIGENIYIPQRFALALGSQTKVQTTTRSPIFAKNEASYPVKNKCKFTLPDSEDIDQYLYNLSALEVEQIIVLAESVQDPSTWSPLLTYLETVAPVTWISLTGRFPRGDENEL